MLLTTVGSGLNALFSLRAPSISITSIVALLVAHPLGIIWSKIIPSRKFRTLDWEWSLNPGPFNIKEHTLIVIMANASFGGGAAYFTDTIQSQKVFYYQDFGMAHDFSSSCRLFLLSSVRPAYISSDSLLSPSSIFRLDLEHFACTE